MATPTVTQAVNAQVVSTSNVVTLSATAANALIVVFAYNDATESMSVTDSASQTYTQVTNSPVTVGGGTAQMWYKAGSASITSVTVSVSSNATLPVVAYEIAGAATGTPFDANASNAAVSSNAASGNALTSGTLSTSNANDILLYGMGMGTAGNWTVGSGFSFNSQNVTSKRAVCQSKGVSATQSSVTTSITNATQNGVDRLGIFAAFADTNQAATFLPEEDLWDRSVGLVPIQLVSTMPSPIFSAMLANGYPVYDAELAGPLFGQPDEDYWSIFITQPLIYPLNVFS